MSMITACILGIFFLALAGLLNTWPSKGAASIIYALVMVAAFVFFCLTFVHG